MGTRSFKKFWTKKCFGSKKRRSPNSKMGQQAREPASASERVAQTDEGSSTSHGRSIKAGLEPRYISRASCRCARVGGFCVGYRAQDKEPLAAPLSDKEFTVIKIARFSMIAKASTMPSMSATWADCPANHKAWSSSQDIVLIIPHCGTIANQWSSPRMKEDRSFKVNMGSIQAIRSIGKGQTALNDFWAIMSVLCRGLHRKTAFEPEASGAKRQ